MREVTLLAMSSPMRMRVKLKDGDQKFPWQGTNLRKAEKTVMGPEEANGPVRTSRSTWYRSPGID